MKPFAYVTYYILKKGMSCTYALKSLKTKGFSFLAAVSVYIIGGITMITESIKNKIITDVNAPAPVMDKNLLGVCPEPTELMKESANLLFRIPVFLSHPSRLNTIQQQFVDAMIRQIRKEQLFPRTLPDTEQYPETPLTNIRRMILSSYGLVALNLRQREVTIIRNNLNQPIGTTTWEGSPYAQIEPAMAYQRGLPMLLIRETGVEQSGLWFIGAGPFFIMEWDSTAADPIESFFTRKDWKAIFKNWVCHVRSGYYIQTQPEFQYSCFNEENSR